MLSSRLVFRASRAVTQRQAIAQRSTIPIPSARRNYAQPAAPTTTQSVKPPLALYGLDGTYATALYTAATKTATLESVSKALASLSALLKKDAKLPTILNIPMLNPSDRSEIVNELLKHLGGVDKQNTVKNFLDTLAENNRLGVLEGVCEKFEKLIRAYQGEIELTVTSASPLDNRTLSRLETAVLKSQYIEQGQKIKTTNKVNPDILGGLLVEIGDRTIDLSVSSKITKLNKLLTDSL